MFFLKENSDRKTVSSSLHLDSIKPFKSSTIANTVEINQGMLNPSSWGFPFPLIRQNLHMHSIFFLNTYFVICISLGKRIALFLV